MKNNLDDIRNKLENEAETAKALTEVMMLIHAGAYSLECSTFFWLNGRSFRKSRAQS